MRYLALLLLVAVAACNGGGEPPPPSTTTTTVEEPPPPPPPPPVTGCDIPPDARVDSDYIPLDRADYWQRELRVYDQRLINNGVRNPFFAISNCPEGSPASVWPYNGISQAEAGDVIDRATELKNALTGEDGVSGFYERVAEQHPSRPKGRSRVYRPCFNEFWFATLEITDGCAERDADGDCIRYNPSSSPTGPVARLDGVKGACEAKLN